MGRSVEMPTHRLGAASVAILAAALLLAVGAEGATTRTHAADTTPPAVGAIQVSFARPVTTYHITAVDPDGDTLTHKWTKQQAEPCGGFSGGNDSPASWSHPDKDFDPPGACPDEPVHAAVISVEIKVGHDWICTAKYEGGSAPG